jgi:hypothetical protein
MKFDEHKIKLIVEKLSAIPLEEWKLIKVENDFLERFHVRYNGIDIQLRPRDMSWRPYLIINNLKIWDTGNSIDELSSKILVHQQALKEKILTYDIEKASLIFESIYNKFKV